MVYGTLSLKPMLQSATIVFFIEFTLLKLFGSVSIVYQCFNLLSMVIWRSDVDQVCMRVCICQPTVS